jgi:hypothetical protein
MSDPYERMKASGIELTPCTRPAGSYAPEKVFGSLVFASGQTPRAMASRLTGAGWESISASRRDTRRLAWPP